MSVRDELREIWPPYGLTLSTPRLELRLPTEPELLALAAALRAGTQAPGTLPFHEPWLSAPSPEAERGLLQSFAGSLAGWEADDWTLQLVAFLEGRPVGMQHLFSRSFAATRCVGSSSWLVLPHQGQGLGTEMGHAILTLAFEGLGAREAYIGAWADNAASLRVMEKLGYLPNGQYVQPFGDTSREDRRMRLPRDRWLTTPRPHIRISGLAPCLPLFGIHPA